MPRPSAREPTPAAPGIPRTECAWLIAALIAGAWLRLAYLDRLAVEHFDEAVYSSNLLYGPENGYEFPGRAFFAPPLLPWTIEWLQLAWSATGASAPGWLPMLPALVCGIATIPSMWWIARTWFSPSSGIAAAWLIALCEFHAAYSRTALTDVPLTFFLLWALYWFSRALQESSKWFALLAGAFIAAAWWTKYSGWLAIAIAMTGTALFLLATRAPRREWLRKAAVCGIAASFAAVLWMPVLWDCENVGGYAAVAANHRGYVEGFSAWWKNARLQFEDHGAIYAGWLTALGICGPSICAGIGRYFQNLVDDDQPPLLTWDGQRSFWLIANALIVAVNPSSWFPVIIGVGTVCSWLALRRAVRERTLGLALNAAFVLVWVVSLVVATPLYRAYPRLTLPLIVGALLAGSVFWRRGWVPFTSPAHSPRRWWAAPAALLTMTVVLGTWHNSIAWEDRTFYRAAAKELAGVLSRDGISSDRDRPIIVYASGEPALVYWLHQSGIATVNAASLDVHGPPGTSTCLAIGPVTRTAGTFREEWDHLAPDFEEIAIVRLTNRGLSSIVLLDQDVAVQERLRQDALGITLWRRK